MLVYSCHNVCQECHKLKVVFRRFTGREEHCTGIGSKTGEESFYGGYVGWSASQQVEVGNPVDAIGGATISSRAVVSAINSAIDCYNNEIAGVA